ncbi:MAG: DNA polymerase III subunit epsilon [Rickettsiales bacterium]|nr:DNA polymerase III subunit epsilon [Rickettsiales bacterium]|tara:strand:- start:213 stop:908 length:696 start_codon:yes stop_codon:yes gene_type:complete
MREIVLDTETTGLDPESGHRIVEIGCVELINHIPTGKTYHQYINPERDMPAEAFSVHGLSEKFLSDFPTFKEVQKGFIEFISDSPLIIHNAAFDMKFIQFEIEQAGAHCISNKIIDTLVMARQAFPGSPASLDALCKRYKIDNAHRVKHGALLDSEILAEVYLELIGGRQIDLFVSHGQTPENKSQNKFGSFPISVKNFSERTFAPSDEELENHQAYLKKYIKDTIWQKDI